MPRILIADDNDGITYIMKALMESKGWTTMVAENGHTALDRAIEMKPDVAVVDVMMPEMSGLDLLPMIKKVSPKTAVIMVTVLNSQEMRDEAEQKGAVAFLNKPFHVDNVLELVSDILEAKGYSLDHSVQRPLTA